MCKLFLYWVDSILNQVIVPLVKIFRHKLDELFVAKQFADQSKLFLVDGLGKLFLCQVLLNDAHRIAFLYNLLEHLFSESIDIPSELFCHIYLKILNIIDEIEQVGRQAVFLHDQPIELISDFLEGGKLVVSVITFEKTFWTGHPLLVILRYFHAEIQGRDVVFLTNYSPGKYTFYHFLHIIFTLLLFYFLIALRTKDIIIINILLFGAACNAFQRFGTKLRLSLLNCLSAYQSSFHFYFK